MKNRIKETVEYDVLYNLETSFENVIDYLNNIVNTHPNHFDFNLGINYDYDGTILNIIAYREEADKEYNYRIENTKKQEADKKREQEKNKINKEKKELEELKRLKEKYE